MGGGSKYNDEKLPTSSIYHMKIDPGVNIPSGSKYHMTPANLVAKYAFVYFINSV